MLIGYAASICGLITTASTAVIAFTKCSYIKSSSYVPIIAPPEPVSFACAPTARAARVLSQVDAVAAEDTRVTRKIYEACGLASPSIRFSCHEHNEEQVVHRILGLLETGKNVAICTDGGMPALSDPGYRVINACRDSGYTVETVPGPSAVTTALVASGLPVASFTFKGFPPRKSGARKRFLNQEKELPHTLIFFESPYRLHGLLENALEVLGDREAAVCLELTKKHERVCRDYLSGLVQQFTANSKIRGEITVVIAGNNPKFVNSAMPEA